MNDDNRRTLVHPIVITEEEKTWHITKNEVMEGLDSNHVEADTRIIMEHRSYFTSLSCHYWL